VVQTGVGPARAEFAARHVAPARLFLSCGCAAALVDWLHAGDLVCAERVITLDPHLRPTGTVPAAGAGIAAWAARRGTRVYTGTIAATPTVLGDRAAKQRVAAGAVAADMESGAVGGVARARGIPFLAVRVVLDEASQELSLADDVIDESTGEMRFGRALLHLLPPWHWPATTRLARQARIADRRLRGFLPLLLDTGAMLALGSEGEWRADVRA
jgi:adenosylhomocysteine nucleosidase